MVTCEEQNKVESTGSNLPCYKLRSLLVISSLFLQQNNVNN